MGQMLIRKLDDGIVAALKARAQANNRSAEAEARTILAEALVAGPVMPAPPRRKLTDFIGAAPSGRTIREIVRDVRALRDEWPD